MKHIKRLDERRKTFEEEQEEKAAERKDKVELFQDLLDENPLSKENDFYLFLARDEFKETKDGLYQKTIEIENMVRMSGDENSLGSMQGLQMRAMFQHDCKLYHIWLPKDLRNQLDHKGSNSIEPWLVELINKYKRIGSDQHGKDVYKEILTRRENIKKCNL